MHVCHLCVTSACLMCGLFVLCGLSVMCFESFVGNIVVALGLLCVGDFVSV